MTFKHSKFDDSAVLRSLEKIAVQKGLVKNAAPSKSVEELVAQKTASAATGDFSQDIIKLCNNLRKEGFHKQAEELESKYINYKKANTLYQTSKETGEDLVHAAHPKGSHKLEGVDSKEAVFEDILDRQLKMIDMVNKTPTGKLSVAQALRAVKFSLAASSVEDLSEQINQKYRQAEAKYNQAKSISNEDLYINVRDFDRILNITNISGSTIDDAFSNFQEAWNDMEPGYGMGVSDTTWARVRPLMESVRALLGQIKDLYLRKEQATDAEKEAELRGDKETSKDPTAKDSKDKKSTSQFPMNPRQAAGALISSIPSLLPDGAKDNKDLIEGITSSLQKSKQFQKITSSVFSVSEDEYQEAKAALDRIVDKASGSYKKLKKSIESPLATEMKMIASLKREVISMSSSVSFKSNPKAMSWVTRELAALDALTREYQHNVATQLATKDEDDDPKEFSDGIKRSLSPQLLREIGQHRAVIEQAKVIFPMTEEEKAAAKAAGAAIAGTVTKAVGVIADLFGDKTKPAAKPPTTLPPAKPAPSKPM